MPLSDTELKAILEAERSAALSTNSSALSDERSDALKYYLGDMTDEMPSGEGRSKAVSFDVADTIEGLMPPLMEIFASSEEVVRFDPVGEEDEEAAQQESDYVNHVFMQKNDGFLVLYTFCKDALLSKNGIVKVDWETGEREERETYLGKTVEELAPFLAGAGVEIINKTASKDEQGQEVFDVTLANRKEYGCAKVFPVPPEEFGISRQARSIKDSNYCYHELSNLTEADLIAQGFDADQVRALVTMGDVKGSEAQVRDTVEEDTSSGEAGKSSTRPVRLTEHYIRLDYEQDGKPCLYQVTTGGESSEVLKRDGKPAIEMVDVMPFAAMTPVIMTHRFFGRSIADLVMDIQRIKTALVRGLLDNVYLLNNQRVEIAESHAGPYTLDDLLVNRPGGIVRTKQPGGLLPIVNQPLGTALYPAIEYMDSVREWRTGVTRQGQGLAPDSLQNIGERAVLDAASAGRAKVKLIARIFAETGIKDLFHLLHGVIRKNDKRVNTVRLRNKWVAVDPRNWKTREDMTVNVGLGTGSRSEEVQNLMMVLSLQKEAIALPQLGLVEPKNIYNTAVKIIEKVGLKTIEPYFQDPDAPQLGPDGKPVIDPQTGKPMPKQKPEPPPDPDVMKLQMEAQLAEKADQRKAQIEQVQAQADMATNQQKLQAEASNSDREYQLKERLALLEAQLEMQKFEREEARKDIEHQQKMELARESHAASMRQAEFGMMAGAEAHKYKMEQSATRPEPAGV